MTAVAGPVTCSGNPDTFGRYAWGLVAFRGHLVYYELVDDWKYEERPGTAGGVLRIPIRTGNKAWRAMQLWDESGTFVSPISIELLAAIVTDQEHQHAKDRS